MVRRLLLGQVGVAAEHDHLHRPRPNRDRLADLAETDDPERSPAQFQSGELAALPFAAAHARVGASRSTLSTPTPARPMTMRRAPAEMSSASTWTWLRTISAS